MYEKWLNSAKELLLNSWGLDISFALDIAYLWLWFWAYGLNPVITSGYRSPERQAALRNQYQSGATSGFAAKPALKSLHSIDKFGKPAALAVDIQTNNHATAAAIAKYLNIGAGYFFTQSDPVHFYKLTT